MTYLSGHYLYIESSRPQKPGDKARLISQAFQSTANTGSNRQCTVSGHHIDPFIPGKFIYSCNFNESIWAAAWQNQWNGMCTQRRLRTAWASAQSDQSLRCALNRKLRAQAFFMQTGKTDQSGLMPRLIWVFAGCTGHFVHFVMLQLICHLRGVWFIVLLFLLKFPHLIQTIYHNDPKSLDREVSANSVDPDQTAPEGGGWSGSTLFVDPDQTQDLHCLPFCLHLLAFNTQL